MAPGNPHTQQEIYRAIQRDFGLTRSAVDTEVAEALGMSDRALESIFKREEIDPDEVWEQIESQLQRGHF